MTKRNHALEKRLIQMFEREFILNPTGSCSGIPDEKEDLLFAIASVVNNALVDRIKEVVFAKKHLGEMPEDVDFHRYVEQRLLPSLEDYEVRQDLRDDLEFAKEW